MARRSPAKHTADLDAALGLNVMRSYPWRGHAGMQTALVGYTSLKCFMPEALESNVLPDGTGGVLFTADLVIDKPGGKSYPSLLVEIPRGSKRTAYLKLIASQGQLRYRGTYVDVLQKLHALLEAWNADAALTEEKVFNAVQDLVNTT